MRPLTQNASNFVRIDDEVNQKIHLRKSRGKKKSDKISHNETKARFETLFNDHKIEEQPRP